MPSELRKLGKTITYWFEKIMAFHEIRITNGPTEGLNNLITRVKRVAFGFTTFDTYPFEHCSMPASPTGESLIPSW
jgi:transposase